MEKNRKRAIEIASFILTLMYLIWAICFLSVITSCNNNLYYTEGIVIDYESLEYAESTKMYTENMNKYNKGDIVLVINDYANIVTKVVIEYAINDYWYNVIFIGNSKKGEKNG